MGRLLNKELWVDATNQMRRLIPPPNQSISDKQLSSILEVPCRALTDVLRDTDFDADLSELIEIRNSDGPVTPEWLDNFQTFFGDFAKRERELLIQSGMDQGAASDLLDVLRTIAKSKDKANFRQEASDLGYLIKTTKTMCCTYAERAKRNQITFEKSHDRRELASDALEATAGVALISIDASVMEPTSIIGGGLVIFAVIRRRW